VLIAPLDANGSLKRAIAEASATAQAPAARLAPQLRGPPLAAATGDTVGAAAEAFAGDVIAKMVVIGARLRALTQGLGEERPP
jgi:hypothetical protein